MNVVCGVYVDGVVVCGGCMNGVVCGGCVDVCFIAAMVTVMCVKGMRV